MSYSNLQDCVLDLEKKGMLVRIQEEVDPYLEIAEIHRRVYEKEGPAILFERVKGSPFKAVSNIYGTTERVEFLFRHTLPKVRKVIQLKADPTRFLKEPFNYLGTPFTALKALPRKVSGGRFLETSIAKLPQIVSWPKDGGAFITLPQVLTLPPDTRSIMQSNLGMYRIQLSGNQYQQDNEVGMHYQIHRGIGIHHEAYKRVDQPFKASIFVGGPPSHALAAIFPLPEGLSELTFAGMMGGRRFRYQRRAGHIISNDADFVITGTISKLRKKPEGPFGDHLGYYSLEHDFPVMQVEKVYHRKDALWHFTVVGRPPAEDSGFGHIIHTLVGPLLASEFPGVRSINAVDEAGVHPLLLAVGTERYMPFREEKPEEILTQANHILGSGQTSLAKFLMIAAGNDFPHLTAQNSYDFFQHMLGRIDWRRDLHFQTRTTIDTLDYSGSGWNEGSKVVMAAHGPVLRTLGAESDMIESLQRVDQIRDASLVSPGIIAVQVNPFESYAQEVKKVELLCEALGAFDLNDYPLLVICDDAPFLAEHWSNFLWVTFTRSNPSHDIYGVDSFTDFKHWGCKGPLVIDARIKPHHAPVLVPDERVSRRVDRLFSSLPALRSL